MPELCGSTTFSASSVANAASAAVPPCRSISAPALAARGSAALTTPGAVEAALREVVAQAESEKRRIGAKRRERMALR
jgi:hypothetical protein